MIVALHSRLKEGTEEAYVQAHQAIPADLVASFHRIGIHHWSIWRSGRSLFHLVECDDYVAAMTALQDDPADEAWQERMRAYVDRFVGGEAGPAGQILPHVWSLSDQLAERDS